MIDADDQLRSLLDEASAEVPDGFAQAPLDAVRRRARRRRVLGNAAVVVAILAVGAPVVAVAVNGSVPRPGPGGPGGPASDVVAWQQARVDRATTGITLYAAPTACGRLSDLRVDVRDTGDAVVLTLHARQVPGDCDMVEAGVAPLTLTEPLGDRPLLDGADGGERRAFRDAALPILPAGWQEQPVSFGPVNGTSTFVQWYRPQGLAIGILVATEPETLDGWVPAGDIALGSRTATIHRRTEDSAYSVTWQSGDLHYRLHVDDHGTPRLNLDEVRSLLATFQWS